MKSLIQKILIQLALCLSGALYLSAQIRAVTSDGDEVVLYSNGTWAYVDRNSSTEPPVSIDAGASGRHVGIMIQRRLLFILTDGQLEDLLIYDNNGRPIFSYRDGAYRLPYGWKVQYDLGSNRPRRVGPYTFEYHWRSGRLEKVGDYKIDYDFISDRVEAIGYYQIEYDFMSGRLSKVGDITISYDLLTKGIEQITGHETGVEIYFMSDGKYRP